MKRVVVTGMGAITPIGLNVDEFWDGIHQGKIGFSEITQFDTTEYKVKIAGNVKALKERTIWIRSLQDVWSCSVSMP